MLRRTATSLMLRRTPRRLMGERPHPIFLDTIGDGIPNANENSGFILYMNGPLKYLRFFEIKWILNRCVQLGRDGYIGASTLFPIIWFVFWKLPQKAMWSDGPPPRRVDWNKDCAGMIPMTQPMQNAKQ